MQSDLRSSMQQAGSIVFLSSLYLWMLIIGVILTAVGLAKLKQANQHASHSLLQEANRLITAGFIMLGICIVAGFSVALAPKPYYSHQLLINTVSYPILVTVILLIVYGVYRQKQHQIFNK